MTTLKLTTTRNGRHFMYGLPRDVFYDAFLKAYDLSAYRQDFPQLLEEQVLIKHGKNPGTCKIELRARVDYRDTTRNWSRHISKNYLSLHWRCQAFYGVHHSEFPYLPIRKTPEQDRRHAFYNRNIAPVRASDPDIAPTKKIDHSRNPNGTFRTVQEWLRTEQEAVDCGASSTLSNYQPDCDVC